MQGIFARSLERTQIVEQHEARPRSNEQRAEQQPEVQSGHGLQQGGVWPQAFYGPGRSLGSFCRQYCRGCAGLGAHAGILYIGFQGFGIRP